MVEVDEDNDVSGAGGAANLAVCSQLIVDAIEGRGITTGGTATTGRGIASRDAVFSCDTAFADFGVES